MSPRRYDQRLRAEAADETRRRILDALYARLQERPAEPVSVEEIAQLARVARSTVYLIFGSRMFAAHRDVFRVLYSMAQLDANAVGGAVQRLEAGRSAGMARLAERLAAQDLLRPGVTPEDAGNMLWLLSSFDSFDVLYTGRGLSLDAVVELQTAMAERALYR
jgi:AcrR family transcriptional regulator